MEEPMPILFEFPVFVEQTQSVITLFLTQEVINKVQTGNISAEYVFRLYMIFATSKKYFFIKDYFYIYYYWVEYKLFF